jgi:SAM-dependent methyltransferase
MAKEYVLGTHDEELQRLGFQHRLWSAEAVSLWERAGFGTGKTILDVGCGPGYASLELAALVGPAGRVIAVDEAARFLEHLRARCRMEAIGNVEAREGDVQHLDLPPASIDGAYARWVLCFVANPRSVVAGVARALRPGGTFAVQDYLYYRALRLAPRGTAMARTIEAVDASWRARGGDPDIVLRLPGIMTECGLRVREVRPIVRVARPDSALWQWPGTFFRIYIPTLIGLGLLTAEDQRAFEAEWAECSANPSALFSTPIVADVIGVKA